MDYNLDALGWYQFENLCQAILKARLGPVLEAWGGNRDLGRDAYSAHPLRYPDTQTLTDGPFVFQAKFVANANASGANPRPALIKAVRAECVRIRQRGGKQPAYYTLMTNVPLTVTLRGEVIGIIKEAASTSEVITEGYRDLTSYLDNLPELRLSYPQLLGLADLRALLTSATLSDIVNRSDFAMEEAQYLAARFVPTNSYDDALACLAERNFAVLLGPPEMGKTATALMIGLGRLTSGWHVYDCRSPNDLYRSYDPDRDQLFLADDAFGNTEYQPNLAQEWAAELHRIIGKLNSNHHLLWTSRPAPLREGLRQVHLQGVSSDFPEPEQVEVNAAHLTVPQKAQMLYRHAKAAEVSREGADLIRAHAEELVSSRHFTPLRIQRFVKDQLPNILAAEPDSQSDLIEEAIEHGLQTPTQAMKTSLSALDEEHRAVLISLLNGPQRPTIDQAERLSEQYHARPFELSVEAILRDIDDHFIHLSTGPPWPRLRR